VSHQNLDRRRLLRGLGEGRQLRPRRGAKVRGPEGAAAEGHELGAETVGLALRDALDESLALEGAEQPEGCGLVEACGPRHLG